MSLFHRTPPRKSNRITKADMHAALTRYAQEHNKPVGHVVGGLYVHEWGDHPVKFYLAEDANGRGQCTQVSPQMTRREMYTWLMTK